MVGVKRPKYVYKKIRHLQTLEMFSNGQHYRRSRELFYSRRHFWAQISEEIRSHTGVRNYESSYQGTKRNDSGRVCRCSFELKFEMFASNARQYDQADKSWYPGVFLVPVGNMKAVSEVKSA